MTNDQYMRIVRLADLRPSATTWLSIVKSCCKANTDLIITHGTAAALQNYIDREHGRERRLLNTIACQNDFLLSSVASISNYGARRNFQIAGKMFLLTTSFLGSLHKGTCRLQRRGRNKTRRTNSDRDSRWLFSVVVLLS